MAWTEVALGKQHSLPETGRPFLVESQRRVLWHCQKMLAHDNLSDEQRQRLLRLLAATEKEMQQLYSWRALEAA